MHQANQINISSRYTRYKSLLLVATLAASFCSYTPALAFSQADEGWTLVQQAGTAALDASEYGSAETLFKEAVARAQAFGPNDMRLAKSAGELGRLYTIRGRFTEAAPYLEEELRIKKAALGEENGQIIPAMGSLVRFYLTYGNSAKADPLTDQMLAAIADRLKQARAKSQVKMMPGQPLQGWCATAAPEKKDDLIDWAIACDAVGNDYRLIQKFDLAEKLFQTAMDLKTTVYGNNHLTLANSYDNMGTLYMAKEDYSEAEGFYEDALSITEKTVPDHTHEIYNRLDKLAKCLMKEQKYDKAEALYTQALTFWTADQPSKYGDDARAMYSLGSIYIEQKNFEAAAAKLDEALQAAERFNGPSSIALVPYLEKYAYALYYLGRKPDVDRLRARASTISGVM
jgi:tetratricopeptide (TPR) repeat protein